MDDAAKAAKRKVQSTFGLKRAAARARAAATETSPLPGCITKMSDGTGKSLLSWFYRLFFGIISIAAVFPRTIGAGADALSMAAHSMEFTTNLLYLVAAVWGLVYSYNIDTDHLIGQDLQHVGLFILLSQAVIRLFSAFILILFATSIIVLYYDSTGEGFVGNARDIVLESWFQDKGRYTGGVFSTLYQQYIAPIRHHMLTVVMFASVFIYFNEDLETKLQGGITGDQWLIAYIIFVGVLRAIIEVKHSRDARIKNSKEDATLWKSVSLGDAYDLRTGYQNKPMRGPSLLLGGTLLFYNLWYGDGFGGGYSIVFNVALIVYLVFVLIEKLLVHQEDSEEDYEWGYGDSWAVIGLASTTMLVSSAMNLADRINENTTVEGALVAALGAILLDVSRLGYGSRSFSDPLDGPTTKWDYVLGVFFRAVHALVGIIGLVSVYIQETDEEAKIGVIPSLRLFVVVASLVKIVGFFYSVFFSKDGMFCKVVNVVPMQKQNVENTLRQGSTIVLLLASTILKDNASTTWGLILLIFACAARVVDCLQDSILEFGKDPLTYIKGNFGEKIAVVRNKYATKTSLSQGQLIMSPEVDNPRSWIVLGGLISTAYLIIQVMHYENEDYNPESADADKMLDGNQNDFDGFIILALILVLAHIVLVSLSFLSTLVTQLKMILLSRIPLFRVAVTSGTLISLAICANQINLGYDEVASTTPSPLNDPFKPNWSQLHLLAAIVIYIFTDMIGHVFL